MNMTIADAKQLVKELTQATTEHVLAVNTLSRKKPETACKKEAKAIWKVLTALTDSPIAETDVSECME